MSTLDIGYSCLEVSATSNINISKVKELMVGKVSMFAGHSGVGKSTLVNALEPGLNLKTKRNYQPSTCKDSTPQPLPKCSI